MAINLASNATAVNDPRLEFQKTRIGTAKDTAIIMALVKRLDPDSRVSIKTSERVFVPTALRLGSQEDALKSAMELTGGVQRYIEQFNTYQTLLSSAGASPDPAVFEEAAQAFKYGKNRAQKLLNYYADTLALNFRLSGPLYSKETDGRLTMNALKIGHRKYGSLLRIDAEGRVTPAGAPPRTPAPTSSTILDQRV